MILKTLTAAATACALAACSGMGGSAEADYDSLKADALASISAARALGYEWRDTGKIVDKAEAAYNKGDIQAAVDMLKKARMQGELAVAQAKAQADAAERY